MDNFAVIVSKKDLAGMNIKNQLLGSYDFKFTIDAFYGDPVFGFRNLKIYTVDEESYNCNDIDKHIKADIFIFATRHRSSEGVNSLSVHVPGNWGEARLGGISKRLCMAPSSYMKECLLNLSKISEGSEYEITYEQTHHGPIMSKPCFFIEIGSNEKHWVNPKSGKIIADTIIKATSISKKSKAAIFLGGGHYNHEANKVSLLTDYAIGHICAKHSLEDLDESMLSQAIEKTLEDVEIVILDWKGLGQYKSKVLEILTKNNIKFERSKKLVR